MGAAGRCGVVPGAWRELVYAGYSSRTALENEVAAANSKAASQNDLLTKEVQQMDERIAQLRGQLDVTSQKLGLTQDELARARTLAQQIQKQQQDSDAQLAAQIGQVKTDTDTKIGAGLDRPDRRQDRHRVDQERSRRHQSQTDLDRRRSRRAKRADCTHAGRP